jgi:hypothetical protein
MRSGFCRVALGPKNDSYFAISCLENHPGGYRWNNLPESMECTIQGSITSAGWRWGGIKQAAMDHDGGWVIVYEDKGKCVWDNVNKNLDGHLKEAERRGIGVEVGFLIAIFEAQN